MCLTEGPLISKGKEYWNVAPLEASSAILIPYVFSSPREQSTGQEKVSSLTSTPATRPLLVTGYPARYEVRLTSDGIKDGKGGRAASAQERDGRGTGEFSGTPFDSVGLAGGNNIALARSAYDGVSRGGILGESRGGKSQHRGEDGSRTHFDRQN